MCLGSPRVSASSSRPWCLGPPSSSTSGEWVESGGGKSAIFNWARLSSTWGGLTHSPPLTHTDGRFVDLPSSFPPLLPPTHPGCSSPTRSSPPPRSTSSSHTPTARSSHYGPSTSTLSLCWCSCSARDSRSRWVTSNRSNRDALCCSGAPGWCSAWGFCSMWVRK